MRAWFGPALRGGAEGCRREGSGAEAGCGAVHGCLDASAAFVERVEGELVGGAVGVGEVVGAQGDLSDAGALEGEGLVQLVGGAGQRS